MRSVAKLTLITTLCALVGCTAFVEYWFGTALGSAIEDRWGEASAGDDVETGLRELLQVSARRAVSEASDPDGAWLEPSVRIAVPAQLRSLASPGREGELRCPVDRLELDLNAAAQRAVPGALGSLTREIRALAFSDPQALVSGGPTAATDLFRDAAAARLVDQLAPLVARQLSQLELYATCGELDRRSPASPAAAPPLVRHVAQGTVAGLFVLIAREEARLRRDPAARTSPALRGLFARADAAEAR